jgi:hypothetical protein
VQLQPNEVPDQSDPVIGQRLTAGGVVEEVILYAGAGSIVGGLSQYLYAVDEMHNVRDHGHCTPRVWHVCRTLSLLYTVHRLSGPWAPCKASLALSLMS